MSILELLPQTLFASIVDGSIFALATVGFSLTYSILKFPNIAQAAFITFGAYVAYSISTTMNLGFELGIVVAFVATGILGAFSYFALFRPLARRTPGFIAPTVASVGYGLALTYIIQQIWGRNQLFYSAIFRSFSIGAIAANWIQLGTIFLTVALVVSIHILLSKTKFGAAMRATSSNPDLVRASGIKTVRIILIVWFLGSALAGAAGVLLAGQTGVTPAVGSNMLVTIIAVAIFAGIGSYYGVIAAAFILSFAENLSVPILIAIGQPVYYNTAVAYIVVILVMLYFPSGLSGSGPKITSIFRRNKSSV
ncbi:MAG: branched-chain amino acid ABC transporter permease [Thaumarchaeota archaeon]|nr:branched-chain amino acid ABC transporter permease [Nitrososphaerota archaeon]MDG6907699.1 branched-chain amino acid ABC transporter permease [Nitrososphaerota archaeon]